MVQWATALRNAWVAQTETLVGTSPVMKIRSGTAPANCEAADTGTVLATIAMPSDWLSAPSAGVGTGLGMWEDTAADASGDMGHFRLYDSGGTCWMQGTISTTSGDMVVTDISVTASTPFTISTFLATAVGA